MAFTVMGFSMGHCSKLCRIIVFIGHLWMIVDIIMDCLTVNQYYKLCQAEELDCLFWKLGVFFLFLPTIMATTFMCFLALFADLGGEDRWKSFLLAGPLYTISAPCYTIGNSAQAALCCDTELEKKRLDNTAMFKLFEVIGEALPQVRELYTLRKSGRRKG